MASQLSSERLPPGRDGNRCRLRQTLGGALGILTETALTAREPAWTDLGHLHVCYSPIARSSVGLLTVGGGLSPTLLLAFGSLFLILGPLAQSWYMGRWLVFLQLDLPCFADIHGRSALSGTETEEWVAGGDKAGTGRKGRRGNCSQDTKLIN